MDVAALLHSFSCEKQKEGKEKKEAKEATENEFCTFVKDRQFNDQRYHICTKKLRQLGWQPTIPFEQGLKTTFQWYATHADEYKIAVVTRIGFS
jgi:dTDP-D-glucose 4,6-dehydratase